jgi:hypothetical protein
MFGLGLLYYGMGGRLWSRMEVKLTVSYCVIVKCGSDFK